MKHDDVDIGANGLSASNRFSCCFRGGLGRLRRNIPPFSQRFTLLACWGL